MSSTRAARPKIVPSTMAAMTPFEGASDALLPALPLPRVPAVPVLTALDAVFDEAAFALMTEASEAADADALEAAATD